MYSLWKQSGPDLGKSNWKLWKENLPVQKWQIGFTFHANINVNIQLFSNNIEKSDGILIYIHNTATKSSIP